MLVLLMVVPINMSPGIRAPLESMPECYAIWLYFSIAPLCRNHFGILLRRSRLNVLWDSILAMALLGSLLFGLGLWRFRRQFG